MGRPLFLYGTLLDRGVLARVTGGTGLARRLTPGVLSGYRRVALRGTPYPTLVADPGGAVRGSLLRPGPAALRRMIVYEGPSYRLVPVRVGTPRGLRLARAWMAARWRADAGATWPTAPSPG